MAETAVGPKPNAGINAGEVTNTTFDPSKVNAFRISAVIDRLSIHARETAKDNTVEFLNLCLSLARGIDFSIANHEVPNRVQELPSLLNQVCRNKTNVILLSAVMVLMISVKNACQCGWFANKESDELIDLGREIASNFCSSSSFDVKTTSSFSVTSTVMSRFYPRMRMGHKLVYLEVQPGFEAYVSGFHISKDLKPSSGQKIRLFVVQTDDIMTSSCLTGPSKVNFLLNGKGVERRTTVSMDKGPQIPTDVTHLLKYGSNLLQAVGEFEGNYTIALAFVSHVHKLDTVALQDYVQQALTSLDSDGEIIEGSSRVSLNCPISLKRIKTPVKGHSCKHIQCFDFYNYVSINSRRPSWRCPHCNQHVCFTEIRIDRKMAKILEEAATNVTEVVVGLDGSWDVVMEMDEITQEPVDKISTVEQDEPSRTDVLDLTLTDDTIDSVVSPHEADERKLSPTSLQSQLTGSSGKSNSLIPHADDAKQSCAPVEDDFWSAMFLSTFREVSPNVQLNEEPAGNSAPASNNNILPAVSTKPVTRSNQITESFLGDNHIPSATQSETVVSSILPLPQYQFGNSTATSEYGRFQSAPRHITRTPAAVQALPAQTPSPILQKRPRDGVNASIQDGRLAASQSSSHTPVVLNTNRTNSLNISLQPSSLSHQYTGLQRNNSFPSVLPSQPILPRNSTPPHMVSPRTPSSMQSPANYSQPRSHLAVSRDGTNLPSGSINRQPSHMMSAANRNAQMTRPVMPFSNRTIPSTAHHKSNTEVTSPQITSTTAVDSADQNWRPSARMRGALTGQAYAEAMNQYIIQPSQQAQAVRPSIPSNVPAQLQAIMADKNTQHPLPQNLLSKESIPGPEVVLPGGSTGIS